MGEDKLVAELERGGYIKSSEIKKAFTAISRADFVFEDYKEMASENMPLFSGIENVFVSQPSTAAFLLELLKPKKGEKILVIGGGTGWVVALIAHGVSDNGVVCMIEQNEDAVHSATKNLEHYKFISEHIVDVHHTAWNIAHEEHGPYDAIISLYEIPEIPNAWKNILRVGGRMIVPMNEALIVKEKISSAEYSTKRYFGFNFPQFS